MRLSKYAKCVFGCMLKRLVVSKIVKLIKLLSDLTLMFCCDNFLRSFLFGKFVAIWPSSPCW